MVKHPIERRERLEKERFDPVNFLIEAYLYLILQPSRRKSSIHGYRVHEQIRIWNNNPAPIIGFDSCGAHRDIFNRALVLLYHDLVANSKRSSNKQQNARQEVLEKIMKSKANSHTSNA